MDKHIFDELNALDIRITPKIIRDLYKLVQTFEIRGSHSVAFNSQLLGVHPISFKDTDKSMFFDLFGVTEKQLKAIIKRIPTIDKNFRVVSDPMNIFCIWITHISFNQIRSNREQHKFAFHVLKYLHYKFFTSLVNHSFRYGAKEEIMQATVNRLTKKYDIMIYGTWKRVWEARCEEILSTKSIHYKRIRAGTPDEEFLYIIQDIQGRVRERVKKIATVFYQSHEQGVKIRNVASVTEYEDSESSLRDPLSLLDIMVTNVSNELPNTRIFVDPTTVKKISSGFSSVNSAVLKQTLIKISAMASDQMRLKQLDIKQEKVRGKAIIGLRTLVRDIIKSVYRFSKKNKLSFKNKAQIYIKYKNAFSSSRILEPDIVDIKERIDVIMDAIVETKREVTRGSLKIAICMYIVYKALKSI